VRFGLPLLGWARSYGQILLNWRYAHDHDSLIAAKASCLGTWGSWLPFAHFPFLFAVLAAVHPLPRASAGKGCLEQRQSHWTERALRFNFCSMEESDTSVTLEQEKPSGLISVEEAAKRLGLDAFTVYSFIQGDRLSPILDDGGVFLVSEEEANQLAKGKKQ
jgi:hypothetical protein